MKWQCPKHPRYLYMAPGKCLVCKNKLVAMVPLTMQIARAVVSDPKTLRATAELGLYLARRLLK